MDSIDAVLTNWFFSLGNQNLTALLPDFFFFFLLTAARFFDENSCLSIFIGMFWSHYWPALRPRSAMHYMLPSTLSLMWPLLLTHWQCNLTRLMTCSMTSLCEASRSQPRWGVWVAYACVCTPPPVTSLEHRPNWSVIQEACVCFV